MSPSRNCVRSMVCIASGSTLERRSNTIRFCTALFGWSIALWGDSTLGYHLLNLLLHGVAVCLVYLVLRQLQIPGALLAAGIFALHPVQVESVAWITEQKNTLSAVFYLGAMLAYLHFDQTRNSSLYAAAMGLFVCGLLSKTVTATLPAALLVIFWWQRGRLQWQRDLKPLVPFFMFGALAGLFSAWVERRLIGAEGPEFALSALRALPAGRPRRLVLSGKARLAGQAHVHLSPLANRSTGCLAMAVSAGRHRPAAGAVAAASAVARPAGRLAVFCGHAVSGAGILQRLSFYLLFRGRSFSVSGLFGNHRVGGGRHHAGRWSAAGGHALDRPVCLPGAAGHAGWFDLPPGDDVPRRCHAVPHHPPAQSELLDGKQQLGRYFG